MQVTVLRSYQLLFEMEHEMELVTITENDFPEWKTFRQALYKDLDDAQNDLEVRQMFTSDFWYCWLIKDHQGKSVGLIELASRNIVDGCISSPVAYLEGLYLIPECRNGGMGKEIIKRIMSWCTEKGYSELATDTELGNTRAQSFYNSTGFKETDRIVQYRIDL